jgi:ATP-dependent RNA helicase DDX47/RRP3|mmetsp:Transcript_87418/g.141527  ORF Transcript_87418/g.141527 Transcript_87418/m.141527 type:complete len:401 (-) Transcript_87418:2344-3546(-)
MVKFKQLGVCIQLCRICEILGFKKATHIQSLTIPYALKGYDIIGYAQTGSGKTLAFVIPLLQNILINREEFSALIIVPSRELAFQIASQGEMLGGVLGIKFAVLTGGIDYVTQKAILKGKPNILISTPGRLVEHIGSSFIIPTKTKFSFVVDEADKILQIDFDKELTFILSKLPKNKKNFLFSATKTLKINKIQSNWLKNPIRVSLNHNYKLVKNLSQSYCFIPHKYKETYLVYLCNEFYKSSIITFVDTQRCAEKLALLLKFLGFKASCIHGGMNQIRRLKILENFKNRKTQILIATDLASRGLDIPCTDIIINFDIPVYAKVYIHRVGRTARAGKSGRTVSLVTQYDIRSFQKIEKIIGQISEKYNFNFNSVIKIHRIVVCEKERCLKILKDLTKIQC